MEDPVQRGRVVAFFRGGLAYSAVAKLMGVTRQAAYLWHRRYRSFGPEGLVPRVPTGAPPRFPSSKAGELYKALKRGPGQLGVADNRWTLVSVAKLLGHVFGITYSGSGAAGVLRRSGIDLTEVNHDLDHRLKGERATARPRRAPH